MNILLTDVCNRQCDFCFAQSVHEHKGQKFMTKEDFIKAVTFSLKSEHYQIRLLGGEPTLHPQFIEFLDILNEYKVPLYIMTNGVMSKEKVDALFSYQKNFPVSFLCNVAFSNKDTSEMLKWREYFFSIFKHTVTPSVTIADYKFDFDYVVGLIERHNLNRKIRVGVAHPIVGCDNKYLAPKHFKAFNINFHIERQKLLQKDIRIDLDCGTPQCAIPNGRSSCHPIIDVGVDLSVWPCFPLVNFKKVTNVIDFGCGDGGFLSLVNHYYKSINLVNLRYKIN